MSDASGDPSPKGVRWWRAGPRATAALVILVVFIVGALTGASVREFGHRDHDGGPPRIVPGMTMTPAPIEEAEEGLEPGPASERTRARFAKALDLTPVQSTAVDSISRHEFAAVTSIRAETWPRIQSVIDDTRRKIDSVLTPEQRTRYHDMLARQEQRWRQEQAEHDSGARAARKPD